MQRLDCPWCGLRDVAEFQYQGDASRQPPALDASIDEAHDAVFLRDNPRGWHLEWWHHVAGCRRHVKVLRHTLTHEVAATGWPEDTLVPPRQEADQA